MADWSKDIMDGIMFDAVTKEVENQGVFNTSTLTRTRRDLQGTTDSLDPRRSINDECGFPATEDILLEHYAYLYDREPVAARVVEVLPRECWKVTPNLYETEDKEQETAFEAAWKDLPNEMRGANWFSSKEDDEGNPIWGALSKLDELSGVGHFGVLLIGLDDGKELNEPVDGIDEKGGKVGGKDKTRKLTYLRCFDESQVTIQTYVDDKENPRHGQPELYSITLNDATTIPKGGAKTDTGVVSVHWTRIVHVADNTASNELFGTPRMQPVLNNLMNLQKIYGADPESFWKNVSRDLILETHPQLGGKVRYNAATMRAELEKFKTGLQRELILTGFTGKHSSPSAIDPTPHVDVQIDAICIRLEIPKRVFLGSERGELASSQDKDTWEERLSRRRNRYVSPKIIQPAVNRFILVGVLPQPKECFVSWDPLDSATPEEKAKVFGARMEGLTKYIGGSVDQIIAPMDVLTREMDYDQEEAMQILEAAQEYQEGPVPDEGVEGITGGIDMMPSIEGGEDVAVVEERAKLLGMVGGINGMLDILRALDTGEITYRTAVQLVALFYQIGATEAAAIVGKERPPRKPPEGGLPKNGSTKEGGQVGNSPFLTNFDPDQARDSEGQWTLVGGGKPPKPEGKFIEGYAPGAKSTYEPIPGRRYTALSIPLDSRELGHVWFNPTSKGTWDRLDRMGNDESVYEFSFQDDQGSFKVTGRGHAKAVIRRTVQELMNHVDRTGAEIVTFVADEPSRIGLYMFLTRRVSRIMPGWTGYEHGRIAGTFAIVKEGTNLTDFIATKISTRKKSTENIETEDFWDDPTFWDEVEESILNWKEGDDDAVEEGGAG